MLLSNQERAYLREALLEALLEEGKKKKKDKKWGQRVAKEIKKNKTGGSLTRIAKKHGYESPLSYARDVQSGKVKASTLVKHKAAFAANMNKNK